LGCGLFRRPQMVRLQSRMGGSARLRHFDLRRVCRHRGRRRHSGPAGGAGARVLAGRHLAVVEVLILPFIAQAFLAHQPLVAGAWMGLAVKTDGAAVAAGGITESLILAKNAAEGVNYQTGWILGTATTIKVFIDIFIGIWAFDAWLHLDQSHQRHARSGQGQSEGNLAAFPEIHHRFRNNVFGWYPSRYRRLT
jgi:hypothetical protein